MGFAPDWLALRASADRAARDTGLLAQACGLAGGRIVDLGAGTGASVHAMAAQVSPDTTWVLVDNDPALLALTPRLGGRVATQEADLTALDALPLEDATLVTASALLDLVSQDWLAGLVARLARHRLPFYAALSYDGAMRWTPFDPEDDAVTLAFNADQRSDKGFGPALGPEAASRAAVLLKEHGYRVLCADSPWRLGPDDARLQDELLAGIASAAARAGQDGADRWLQRRRALLNDGLAHIGHIDLLALPPERTSHE